MPALDLGRTAVLVIDMQRDFLDVGAPIETPAGRDIIPALNGLLRLARAARIAVIFTQEMHRPDRSDFGIELEYEPPHCLEGTPGVEIADGIEVAPGDYRIRNKRRYDAFLGTDLETLLRSLRVENVIVTGVCTDICVISTAHHARNLDFRVVVPREGVAGTTRERHDAALACIGHVFGYVVPLAEVEAALAPK